MPVIETDIDGVTAAAWAEEFFEFELCSECLKDKEDHVMGLVLGHWFAWCKS